jgi:hypothetical protein
MPSPNANRGVVEEVEDGTKLFYWMDEIFSKLQGQSERTDAPTYRKLMGRDDPCYEFDWDDSVHETKVWRKTAVLRGTNFSKYVTYMRIVPGQKNFVCTVTVDYSSGSSQFDWIPGKKPTGISVVNGRKNLWDIDADF